MPILRLAYTTQFLIALMAVFVLWSQVGGQSHLDLLPWALKLVLGVAAAYGVVRATAASVSGDRAWNGHAVRWLGFTLAVLAACGYATYYAHMNLEESDEADQPQDTTISRLHRRAGVPPAMPVFVPACFEERRQGRRRGSLKGYATTR
jgi:hypothetical protein